GRTGPPLGLVAGAKYSTRSVHLTNHDLLVLFTDGITEALDECNLAYGERRLESEIKNEQGGPTHDLISHIFYSVRQFRGGAPQSDDMTCLALRWSGDLSTPTSLCDGRVQAENVKRAEEP